MTAATPAIIERPVGSGLLHNMSSPSKTTIGFDGLRHECHLPVPDWLGESRDHHELQFLREPDLCGLRVRFVISLSPEQRRAPELLRLVTGDNRKLPEREAERRLVRCINERARKLSLPDCALVVRQPKWDITKNDCDSLTVLALITKCSECVWLRGKYPRLSRIAVEEPDKPRGIRARRRWMETPIETGVTLFLPGAWAQGPEATRATLVEDR